MDWLLCRLFSTKHTDRFMQTAFLIRDEVRNDSVRGLLAAGGKIFHIIERPWNNNRRNESCIPAGEYHTTFLPRSASGKYRQVYHLQSVPGRSGILIHNGNVVAHSRGCLIIGLRRGSLAGKAAVLNSRSALHQLFEVMGPEPFKLKVIGNQFLSGNTDIPV